LGRNQLKNGVIKTPVSKDSACEACHPPNTTKEQTKTNLPQQFSAKNNP
jgi:hypothetical protein